MAKARLTLRDAIAANTPLWLLVRDSTGKFRYALDLTPHVRGPAHGGAIKFDIPSLHVDSPMTITELWIGVREKAGFMPLDKLDLPMTPLYADLSTTVNITDLVVELA